MDQREDILVKTSLVYKTVPTCHSDQQSEEQNCRAVGLWCLSFSGNWCWQQCSAEGSKKSALFAALCEICCIAANTVFSGKNKEAVREVLKLQWKDDKTRIKDEAIELMLEFTRRLTVEIAMRAANQASIQDELAARVELQHLEKIIPQILLDF